VGVLPAEHSALTHTICQIRCLLVVVVDVVVGGECDGGHDGVAVTLGAVQTVAWVVLAEARVTLGSRALPRSGRHVVRCAVHRFWHEHRHRGGRDCVPRC
jgi:hypothetical protein